VATYLPDVHLAGAAALRCLMWSEVCVGSMHENPRRQVGKCDVGPDQPASRGAMIMMARSWRWSYGAQMMQKMLEGLLPAGAATGVRITWLTPQGQGIGFYSLPLRTMWLCCGVVLHSGLAYHLTRMTTTGGGWRRRSSPATSAASCTSSLKAWPDVLKVLNSV
jgi:hypothetical protein